MKIAYFLAAALLVFGQSAQGAEDDTLPSEACLTSAKKVATKLQAAADSVAGQQVTIDVIGGTTSLAMAFVAENQTVIAEVNWSGSVVIQSAWCALPPEGKVFAIAHEIGHVIDRANNPVQFLLQLPLAGFLTWNDRPTEKRANEYAMKVLRIAAPENMIAAQNELLEAAQ